MIPPENAYDTALQNKTGDFFNHMSGGNKGE